MTDVNYPIFTEAAKRPGAEPVDASRTVIPRTVLGGFIKIQATPGGALAGVPATNIRIVFINSTTQRQPNSGLKAELTRLVSNDPRIDPVRETRIIRGANSREFANTTLVVNYGGTNSITAEQLTNQLNSVDGIDAEILPGGDSARVFTPETLIGFQGLLAEDVEEAEFTTLKDLGWTRMPVCPGTFTPYSSFLNNPKPGHSCFYYAGGDNPNGNINASVVQAAGKWWQVAGRSFALSVANRPGGRADNREYISWEIDTTTAPSNRFGRMIGSAKSYGDNNFDTYINISTREGDLVGAVSATGVGIFWTMPDTRYANDPTWSKSPGNYVLHPNSKYYINIVHCRRGLGSPLPLIGDEITSNRQIEPYPFSDPVDKDVIQWSYFDEDFKNNITTKIITPLPSSTSPIDYASRPSLSDFGWTRSRTCLLVGSTGYNQWHQGHECFYFAGGDNPNDSSGSAGLYANTRSWWEITGLTRRMLFVGGFGASPNQDNRRYISIELDTTGMPTTQAGRFLFNSAQIAPRPDNVIWTISEKEGDFDPVQPIGGYGEASFISQLSWAGQDYVRLSKSAYGNLTIPAQGRFIMRPNTKYYLNMVATRSSRGTTPSEIRPLATNPVRGESSDFDYLENTRMLLFVPYGGDSAAFLRNERKF